MTCFRIGPFLFQWQPDGDDRGVGLMLIDLDGETAEIACSRDEWDEFTKEAGP